MKLKKYTDEQLKEMPLTELSYNYMSSLKRPVSFNKLVDVVFKTAGLDDEVRSEKLGQFYTDLTVDGRFVTFSNGKWDLRYRHRFEAFDWEEEAYDELEELIDEEAPIILVQDDDYSEDEEKIDVEKIVKHKNDEDDDEEF